MGRVRHRLCERSSVTMSRRRYGNYVLWRFGSFLGELMEEHVGLMRSLGYRYNMNEGMLLRFDL
jgi:hypothetical protein